MALAGIEPATFRFVAQHIYKQAYIKYKGKGNPAIEYPGTEWESICRATHFEPLRKLVVGRPHHTPAISLSRKEPHYTLLRSLRESLSPSG